MQFLFHLMHTCVCTQNVNSTTNDTRKNGNRNLILTKHIYYNLENKSKNQLLMVTSHQREGATVHAKFNSYSVNIQLVTGATYVQSSSMERPY